MKITRVEPILIRTPLKLDDAQPHAGGQPKNDVHTVLVKVETDEDLTGWGEAFSNAGWQSTCTAVAQIIAPRVGGPGSVADRADPGRPASRPHPTSGRVCWRRFTCARRARARFRSSATMT